MCLTLRKKNSDKPFNRSTYRWKLAITNGQPRLCGKYQYGFRYYRKNVAILNGLDETAAGFHVFVREPYGHLDHSTCLRIRCSGFLKSGEFVFQRSETWERFTIVGIYENGKKLSMKGRVARQLMSK